MKRWGVYLYIMDASIWIILAFIIIFSVYKLQESDWKDVGIISFYQFLPWFFFGVFNPNPEIEKPINQRR